MNTPTPLEGKYNVLLFRRLKDAATKAGAKIALQVQHTYSSKSNSNSSITKDGPLIAQGSPEKEYSFSFVAAKGDPLLAALEEAHDAGETVECWNPQIDPALLASGGKHPGTYSQGKITDISLDSPAEDYVKISMTYKVQLIPQKGDITITSEQAAALQYGFTDTPKKSE